LEGFGREYALDGGGFGEGGPEDVFEFLGGADEFGLGAGHNGGEGVDIGAEFAQGHRGVDGDGDDAGPEGGEEGGDEVLALGEDEEEAIAFLEAQAAEASGAASNVLIEGLE